MNTREPEKKTKGLACHQCGCRHLFVDNTRKIKGKIIRYRRCRNCGGHVTTCETVVP